MGRLVADAGVTGHRQQTVFSGGSSGNPSALWENAAKRSEIQAILDDGDVNYFGMAMEQSDSTEYYEKWIDYALAKNADTTIMLGVPWFDYPSKYTTLNYTALGRTAVETAVQGVHDSLRTKYPGTTITVNPYNLTIIEARLLFEAGGLPDVDSLFGDCDEDTTGETSCGTSLFSDFKGHISRFGKNLAALVWLNRIYGVDLSSYSNQFAAYETDITVLPRQLWTRTMQEISVA